jgi:2-oxoisovalerate dehydrogenase E1 component
MSNYLYADSRKTAANTALRPKEIPVCRYQLSVSDEKRIYSPREFLRIYRDMALIREFETMLSDLKLSGTYQDITYRIKDDLTLDIGREAFSVGEAYALDKNDLVFSSEKSLGDVIAKGLSAISKMTDYEVADVMRRYHDGAVLAPLAEIEDKGARPKDVAIDYLLYGILSEIFSKITGFHYGLGGASGLYFTPFGSYPNSMTASAAAGLAVGAALYQKNSGVQSCVVANLSEDAAYDGQAWEAFCLSCSGVFREAGKKNSGLPVLFTLVRARDIGENETVVKKCIARIGAGLSPDLMHAETVNGSDPLAVIDAVARKKENLARGEGPALVEFVCDDLRENTAGIDPVAVYRKKLIDNGIISENDLDALDALIIRRVARVAALAANDEHSPRASAENLEAIVYGPEDEKQQKLKGELLPEVIIPEKDCLRLQAIAEKTRTAYGPDGTPVGKDFRYQISDAIFEPILDALYTDPRMIVCGMQTEDDVYEGLADVVRNHRFFRVPSSETALVSLATGYSMCGGRAVVALKNGDSLAKVADVLIRQVAKWRALSGGELRLPILIRVPVSFESDAQNADELLSLAASVPGLKVIYPVTPYDAKGLMTSALRENNPVICFENRKIHDVGEYFIKTGVPQEIYSLPIGDPSLKREGKDLTIVTIGAALYRATEAARILDETYGVQAEIIDVSSIVPLHYAPILRSVEKTGKVIIVGEGTERGSVMRDIASGIAEFAFDHLDAPPIALGARNWIRPASVYKGYYYPTAAAILDVIHQRILPLKDYTPSVQYVSAEEKQRRSEKGV